MTELIAEVQGFLQSLKLELPELFRAKPQPARPAPVSAPASVFEERVAVWSERMELTPKSIRVKTLRSLWGSCGPTGNLNFNRRLLDAPLEVLDYVVIHELAHLRWRGHGPRFWTLVERHCPDYKEHRRWLRLNARRLLS